MRIVSGSGDGVTVGVVLDSLKQDRCSHSSGISLARHLGQEGIWVVNRTFVALGSITFEKEMLVM